MEVRAHVVFVTRGSVARSSLRSLLGLAYCQLDLFVILYERIEGTKNEMFFLYAVRYICVYSPLRPYLKNSPSFSPTFGSKGQKKDEFSKQDNSSFRCCNNRLCIHWILSLQEI